MAYVPSAGRRRLRSSRLSTELMSKAAGYGAFTIAFAFTCALVMGLIP